MIIICTYTSSHPEYCSTRVSSPDCVEHSSRIYTVSHDNSTVAIQPGFIRELEFLPNVLFKALIELDFHGKKIFLQFFPEVKLKPFIFFY